MMTPLTPLYAHVVLPCSQRSPMLIHTESRPRFAEDGVYSGRRKKTKLAMAEGLTKLTMILKQKNEQ